MIRLGLMVIGLSAVSPVLARDLIPVDESYTASRRLDSYRRQYPEIRLPTLTFGKGQQIQFDRRYKKIGERELHIDIFLPPPGKTNRQGLLLVHGGAWRSGSKSEFYPLANLLAKRGYAVFLPEYRLSPEAPYPAGLVDINDALVWVKTQAAAFDLDPGKLALGGGSSGGQMAALLAYSSGSPSFKSSALDDTRVSALIDLDGLLDFTTSTALRYENASGATSSAAQWLGGAHEAVSLRWQEASAARHVDAHSPPTLIISSGEPRYTEGKEQVMTTLAHHGIRSQLINLRNVPHTFWLFEPYLSQTVRQIDRFLKP